MGLVLGREGRILSTRLLEAGGSIAPGRGGGAEHTATICRTVTGGANDVGWRYPSDCATNFAGEFVCQGLPGRDQTADEDASGPNSSSLRPLLLILFVYPEKMLLPPSLLKKKRLEVSAEKLV